MKNRNRILEKPILLLFLAVFTFFINCTSENVEKIDRATAEDFSNLRANSIESKMQHFQFNANERVIFTTEKGAKVTIDGNCLLKNGSPISGEVNITILELYKKGSMLTTNKPTTGKMPNGDMALLISGGEFFIKATHQGECLQINCAIEFNVPTDLTNGADNEMSLLCSNSWGDQDCDGFLDDLSIWEQVANSNGIINVVDTNLGLDYEAPFGNLGGTSIGKFYSDARPKTTLLVDVPEGFNNTNSAVYLSYKEQPNALTHLDTFNESTGLFSEQYRQIPIGMECNVIFVSENNGQWLYAIKDITISEGDTISIQERDLNTTNLIALETIVNNLP